MRIATKTADAIIFLIFLRQPREFFKATRQEKHKKILLVVSGEPRKDHPEDTDAYTTARSIIEQVDRDCEVLKNYSNGNLDRGLRSETGINWVFEQVEEAIILEDDCIPHPSSFQFCEELLL